MQVYQCLSEHHPSQILSREVPSGVLEVGDMDGYADDDPVKCHWDRSDFTAGRYLGRFASIWADHVQLRAECSTATLSLCTSNFDLMCLAVCSAPAFSDCPIGEPEVPTLEVAT